MLASDGYSLLASAKESSSLIASDKGERVMHRIYGFIDATLSKLFEPAYSQLDELISTVTKPASIRKIYNEYFKQAREFKSWLESVTPDVVQRNCIKTYRQYSAGVQLAFSPSAYRFLANSPLTRNIFEQLVSTNTLFTLGSLFVYDLDIKPSLQRSISGFQDSILEDSLDLFAEGFFYHLAINMILDNTIFNMAMLKVITQENSIELEPCKCGSSAKIKATIESALYNISKFLPLSTIAFFSSDIYYFTLPLRLLAYGQMIVEYRNDIAAKCIRDRYRIINQNNAYCFGLGLTFHGAIKTISFLISGLSGSSMSMIEDVVFVIAFNYFIILAATDNAPLPGEREGIDYFHAQHESARKLFKLGMDIIVNKLKQPDSRSKFIGQMKKYSQHPYLNTILSWTINIDLRHPEAIFNRRSMKLLYLLYQDDIKYWVKLLTALRAVPGFKNVCALTLFFPFLSKEAKLAIEILFKKNIDHVLLQVDQFTGYMALVDFDYSQIALLDKKETLVNNWLMIETVKEEASWIVVNENEGDNFTVMIEEITPESDPEPIKQLVQPVYTPLTNTPTAEPPMAPETIRMFEDYQPIVEEPEDNVSSDNKSFFIMEDYDRQRFNYSEQITHNFFSRRPIPPAAKTANPTMNIRMARGVQD